MDSIRLQQLNGAVAFLLRQDFYAHTLTRLKGDLRQSAEPFVWATFPLDAFPCPLPEDIKSCWIFHLKGNVPSGAHYHPNSVQHMIAIDGGGMSLVGGERRAMVPFGSPGRSLEELWYVIPQGVPHEFTPEGEALTVVSFHTCAADELEEVACGSGGKRLYEGT
ncbi:MAG: cupin domain-containing protein [Planctomycetota bacterium]|nr:cupin domain-containing protein [Planctomycetota bacterium]